MRVQDNEHGAWIENRLDYWSILIVFEGSKGATSFNIKVQCIPHDGTLGTDCIICK